jgi:hypothetical protein
MWYEIKITVSCDQCIHFESFERKTAIGLRTIEEDARSLFARSGWLELPSGRWICNNHNAERKEAA